MLCRAGSAAVLMIVLAAFWPRAAAAQQATSTARDCSGTLCDLYYGNSNEAPAPATTGKKDAATPLTVPGDGLLRRMFGGGDPSNPAGQANGQTAPEKKPLVGVGGGGIAAMARGEAPQRCTGTLCDFYYGGRPPETTSQAPPAAAVEPQQATSDASDDAPPRQAAPDPELPVYRAPPRCATTGRDPWSCYR